MGRTMGRRHVRSDDVTLRLIATGPYRRSAKMARAPLRSLSVLAARLQGQARAVEEIARRVFDQRHPGYSANRPIAISSSRMTSMRPVGKVRTSSEVAEALALQAWHPIPSFVQVIIGQSAALAPRAGSRRHPPDRSDRQIGAMKRPFSAQAYRTPLTRTFAASSAAP